MTRYRTLRLYHWTADDMRGPDWLVDRACNAAGWLHCLVHGHSEYERRDGRAICAVCWRSYGGAT